jgi:uncharacterized protein YabE (DUF348 family)
MLEYNRAMKRKLTFLTRSIVVVAVCVCAVFLLAQAVTARNTYLIDDNGRILVHTTYTTDPAKILAEAGVELDDTDIYIQSEGPDGRAITIQRCQNITVICNGQRIETTTYGETVQSMLNRLNLSLTGKETLSVPLHSNTYDGMVIAVSKITETLQTYTESIPYETIYCYDPNLQAGLYMILTAGKEGQLLCTANIQYADGHEIARTQISQTVVRQPVTRIIAVGTGNPMMISEESSGSETVVRGG